MGNDHIKSNNKEESNIVQEKTQIFKNIAEKNYGKSNSKIYTNEQLISRNFNINKFCYVSIAEKYDYYEMPTNNSFIGTLLECYNKHVHLKIRPDDIWLNIIMNFSLFMENSNDELRKNFVNHNGKLNLVVECDKQLNLVKKDDDEFWCSLIDRMCEQIDKNTNNDIAKWIQNDFSTTTNKDKILSKVMLMTICKHYFDYECMTLCGLPKVTLMGTVDDWIKLKNKLDNFDIFKNNILNDWKHKLTIILNEFINFFDDNYDNNNDFWNKIISKISGGSGKSDYYNGWACVFNPFTDKGKYLLDIKNKDNIYSKISKDNIVYSHVFCDITFNIFGDKKIAKLVGGCFGAMYDQQDNSLRPAYDFAISNPYEK